MKNTHTRRSRLFERERRFVHNVGHIEFVTTGLSQPFWEDLYHHLLAVRWPTFFVLICAAFSLINTLFAWLYMAVPHGIAGQSPDGFLGAFFFSVETFATVGYGAMHPASTAGHLVSTAEVLVGMMCNALITGLVFSRFSRPHAKLLFARMPVIFRRSDHSQILMIRVANARLNIISEATAYLRFMTLETDSDGQVTRTFHDLPLERNHHPVFAMGWNIIHEITPDSPLYGKSSASLIEADAQLILSIDGIDDNTDQFMRSRHVYAARDIRWRHRYPSLIAIDAHGVHRIDYRKFHDVEPV